MENREARRNYWLLSGAFLTFFLTWSFSFSFFPIWLEVAVGLTGEDIGVIFSLNAFCAMFVLPLYGFFQDKLGLRKHLLFLVAVLLVGSGPFMIYFYGPVLQTNMWLAAAVGGVYLGMAFGAGVGAVETYVERVGRVTGFEWGKVRMWGSLGWAIATFAAGRVFNIDPDINFWIGTGTGVIFLILILSVHPANSPHQEEVLDAKASALKVADAVLLFRNPKFLALGVYVVGVSCIYSVYDQQFPVYFKSVFSDPQHGIEMYGNLNSLQVFLEAGVMFLAPFLVNRIGAKNGLVLAGVVMATRMLGSGFAETPMLISAMKLMHAIELPIMLVALFKYIAATFDARLSATIYLVGFAFMTQIGATLLSAVVGIMYDTMGFADAYKVLGGVVSFFVVVSWFLLSNDRYNIDNVDLDEDEEDYDDALHPHVKEDNQPLAVEPIPPS